MMKRRRRGDNSLLGHFGYAGVVDRIREYTKQETNCACPFPFTRERLINGSITPDVLDVLKKAAAYSRPYWSSESYDIKIPSSRCTIRLDGLNGKIIAPKHEYVQLTPELREGLDEWYQTFSSIHKKWALVQHVASWFNDYCDYPQVREYWPCMAALVSPKHAVKIQEAGTSRKAPPTGIYAMLPLCRETSTTVAMAQMMPDVPGKEQPTSLQLVQDYFEFKYIDHTGATTSVKAPNMIFPLRGVE